MICHAPLAIELYCGLGGWTEGLLAEGFRVVGFDIERHCYGDARYPAQLVLQDALTIHGRQFKDAALIVASPPCQEYSYMAMPWSRAKQIAAEYRDGTRNVADLTALFDACFRIQREACDAAGRHIPLVVENVRGAQEWVGRARWHYGSFYLWGDVPALMPMTRRAKVNGFRFDGSGGSFQTASVKVAGLNWSNYGKPDYKAEAFNTTADKRLREERRDGDLRGLPSAESVGASVLRREHVLVSGVQGCGEGDGGTKCASETGRRTDIGNGVRFTSRDCGIENTIANAADGCKHRGSGHAWYRGEVGSKSSKSTARKAASAHIAKIPFALARHIARAWHPNLGVVLSPETPQEGATAS